MKTETSKTPTTFATECYSYGPTSGGGRIYNKNSNGPKVPGVRSDKARARRTLKAQYRRMYKGRGPGLKSFMRHKEAA